MKSSYYLLTETCDYRNEVFGSLEHLDSVKCIEYQKAYDYLVRKELEHEIIKEINNKKCR